MLQLISLRAHPLHLPLSRIPNLRLEFRTRGAEEIRFVLDVGFRDEARARERHVVEENLAHGFHDGYALLGGVA